MATRKITVLNPAGYQEIFQAGDDLLVDGDINLQSNALTGLPSPSAASDAASKDYVDTGDILNAAEIQNNADDIAAINLELDGIDLTLYVEKAGSTMTGPLTLSGAPTQNLHSATKQYVDTAKADALGAIGNGTISFTASQNLTLTGTTSFTTNQAGDVTIELQGPDLSNLLTKPSSDGDFIVTRSAGFTSYSNVIDLGTY